MSESERSELKFLQPQENTHRNKVCMFKHFWLKFRVLQLTKIPNTFLYTCNSQSRDVCISLVTSKLGPPVGRVRIVMLFILFEVMQ